MVTSHEDVRGRNAQLTTCRGGTVRALLKVMQIDIAVLIGDKIFVLGAALIINRVYAETITVRVTHIVGAGADLRNAKCLNRDCRELVTVATCLTLLVYVKDTTSHEASRYVYTWDVYNAVCWSH